MPHQRGAQPRHCHRQCAPFLLDDAIIAAPSSPQHRRPESSSKQRSGDLLEIVGGHPLIVSTQALEAGRRESVSTRADGDLLEACLLPDPADGRSAVGSPVALADAVAIWRGIGGRGDRRPRKPPVRAAEAQEPGE